MYIIRMYTNLIYFIESKMMKTITEKNNVIFIHYILYFQTGIKGNTYNKQYLCFMGNKINQESLKDRSA